MNGPGCPTINRRGIPDLPYLGRRWGDTLAFVLDDFFDEKGSPSHSGQDSTILGPGSLRQSLVGAVSVQTDGLLLSVNVFRPLTFAVRGA